MSALVHLARRFRESAFSRSIAETDLRWVEAQLEETEHWLWSKMQTMDKKHSIGVARRLCAAHPDVERAEVAAALLHDVGKVQSSLGVLSRVGATLMGGRTERWSAYLDHERIGARLCRQHEVDDRICDLIEGSGDPEAIERLRAADDI